jgi:LuxR family maltose regulon positive regulatory protein
VAFNQPLHIHRAIESLVDSDAERPSERHWWMPIAAVKTAGGSIVRAEAHDQMATQAPRAALMSKVGAPVRTTRTVARRRLQDRLANAEEVRLVLVSAPAGFGKTTLLAAWLANGHTQSAWLSLDRDDNDVVRFGRGLVAALDTLRPDSRGGGGMPFGAEEPVNSELALARVLDSLEALVAAVPAALTVVVLDDYHLIDEPSVHALVASLLDRLPRRAVLAIATRADPRLPIARLRARGELLEVRGEDLRFSLAEADALLRSAGVDLPLDDVASLATRTEGWAAALRLAAVSLRGRPDAAEVVHRFGASHRFVLDYVIDEVLAGLPPETEEFLLQTSILTGLSGPLCDAVTGRTDSQERLEALERLNLLIVPLDEERRWYRYHGLFAEILQARLRAHHPDDLRGLHARASAWHEERANDDEAIAHALASDDQDRIARCVAFACGRHLNAGELATVRRWLDAVPRGVVERHAQLAAAYAWYFLIEGEPEPASAWLATAERALADGLDGGPAMRPGIPSQLAMLRSQLAGLAGDSATATEEARRALDLVPPDVPAETAAILRGTATVILAVALLGAGDFDGAVTTYRSGLGDLRAGGNELAAGRAVADLARIAIDRGDAEAAVRLCEAELANDDGATDASGAIWCALARAHAVLGDAEPASAAAARALELATRAGDAPVIRSAEATLDRIERSRTGPGVRSTDTGPDPASPKPLVEPLTGRELEVLRLVALGRSNSQIATELFVTVGTVKSHLHTISGKLGAANRVEAVARGRQVKLLD